MSESLIKEEIYRISNIKYEQEEKYNIQKIILNVDIKQKPKDEFQKKVQFVSVYNHYGC